MSRTSEIQPSGAATGHLTASILAGFDSTGTRAGGVSFAGSRQDFPEPSDALDLVASVVVQSANLARLIERESLWRGLDIPMRSAFARVWAASHDARELWGWSTDYPDLDAEMIIGTVSAANLRAAANATGAGVHNQDMAFEFLDED